MVSRSVVSKIVLIIKLPCARALLKELTSKLKGIPYYVTP